MNLLSDMVCTGVSVAFDLIGVMRVIDLGTGGCWNDWSLPGPFPGNALEVHVLPSVFKMSRYSEVTCKVHSNLIDTCSLPISSYNMLYNRASRELYRDAESIPRILSILAGMRVDDCRYSCPFKVDTIQH